jgi:PKHD-type hydroxylase
MTIVTPNPQPFLYTFPTKVQLLEQGSLSLAWNEGEDPFSLSHPVGVNDALSTVQFYPGALKPYECKQVIALGESLPRSAGRVELGNEVYRVGHIAWIEPSAETHWLFHKLGALFTHAAKHYGFELNGFMDALQYTVYEEDQSFDWHADIGTGTTSTRKLSMTIQLSSDDDYVGGELQFVNAPSNKGLGGATFFPSYMAHRVAPVTLGVRRSLVAWACGPTFR